MTYEMKREAADPFDIMCSDCEIHYIEYWEKVEEKELREIHSYNLIDDQYIRENEKEAMIEEFGWQPTPESFDEWLRQEIESGNVREIA